MTGWIICYGKKDTAPLMAYSLIYGIVRRDVRQWGTGDLDRLGNREKSAAAC